MFACHIQYVYVCVCAARMHKLDGHDLGDLGSILKVGEKDEIEFLCVCNETGRFDSTRALDLGFDHGVIAVRFHGIADAGRLYVCIVAWRGTVHA